MKRVFDVIVSAIGLLLGSPFVLPISALIKLTSRGPVFYFSWRIGRCGKPFRLCKFRTMSANADKIGGSSTSDNDPRITKIGKFLRKYKVDEFPQLLNVLKGEMSIVGPRPEVPYYVNLFTEAERAILSVRPGITDLATLWNADEGMVLVGSPDPEKTYFEKIRPQKIKLQLEYVRTQSFWTDIRIIIDTLSVIVLRRAPRALEAVGEESK